MKHLLNSGLIVLGLTFGASAFGAVKAYCTGGSDTGAAWWNWTDTDQNRACGVVFKKVLGFNAAIHRGYYGHYLTNKLNQGRIICKGGKTKNVYGTGAQVFENGLNMANELSYVGCVIKILP